MASLSSGVVTLVPQFSRTVSNRACESFFNAAKSSALDQPPAQHQADDTASSRATSTTNFLSCLEMEKGIWKDNILRCVAPCDYKITYRCSCHCRVDEARKSSRHRLFKKKYL
ncbi:hypothetical protein EVAR_32288_1 [Eumeta japonica]|uniref:Uncharacterized protein n=1 Tax=Eumeta variegata TaxID=151549 RepID=A0A4C1WD34_EUMVA|nr:hypothetical protein EVAR_32288_1 [Eumeta japonica]